MNNETVSAITDALSESARHLWFAMMLARHGSYASAQDMQAAAREVSDTIADAMQLPSIADLLYAELNDLVDVLVLDYAKSHAEHVH